jgi:hypothetical protein
MSPFCTNTDRKYSKQKKKGLQEKLHFLSARSSCVDTPQTIWLHCPKTIHQQYYFSSNIRAIITIMKKHEALFSWLTTFTTLLYNPCQFPNWLWNILLYSPCISPFPTNPLLFFHMAVVILPIFKSDFIQTFHNKSLKYSDISISQCASCSGTSS